MAFNAVNPVSVGLATKKDHYDRVFDNTIELRSGGIAIASQAALDFVHASSASQLARVAAAARRGPRLNDAGTAWVMAAMDQHYVPTVADVANTVAETSTISFSVGANEMGDGDVIEITAALLAKNNKGTAGAVTVKLHWGATSVDLTTAESWDNNASERKVIGKFLMQRVGTDLWVRKRFATSNFDAETSIPLLNIIGWGDNVIAMTPTFSSTQTVAIKITLDVADATFYWKTQKARVWRHPAA